MLERNISTASFELACPIYRSHANVSAARAQNGRACHRTHRDIAASRRCYQIISCILNRNVPAIRDQPRGPSDPAGGYISSVGANRNAALDVTNEHVAALRRNIEIVIPGHADFERYRKMLPPPMMRSAREQ